jgi:hypothetical protein
MLFFPKDSIRRIWLNACFAFLSLLLASSAVWGEPLRSVSAPVANYLDQRPDSFSHEELLGVPTEDFYSGRNFQVASGSDSERVDVPEPLLFDLVRPLGARRGEVEVNTLAIFPWRATNRDLQGDPFGPGPTTIDRQGIEWAPEIEYAIADNFAIEFEFPFEGATLEEYKLGLQWTIGTAFNNQYIHGFQVLIEPSTAWENWNSTLLYLGGIRFDETWSALFMLGGRMDLEGPNNSETFERLTNVSIFADISESFLVGLETNYASGIDGTNSFIFVPQVHWQVTNRWQVQSGLGFGTFTEGSERSFILRVVWSPS